MIRAGLAGAPTEVDVLVVGLGVTGAGVALKRFAGRQGRISST